MNRLRTYLVLATLAVALALLATYVVEPVTVPSTSMMPTLDTGDQLIVDKLGPRLSSVHRGQLIVFHQPGSDTLLVKRVAAISGDEVGIDDGVLIVNGQPVPEPYVDHSRVDGVYFGPIRVPAGNVFVLGDDRANSVDSRVFGPVPLKELVGVVALRVWPLTWFH